MPGRSGCRESALWLKSWGTAFLPPACLLSCRPVCGVAGIPSSQSGAQHHLQHSASSAAALPHCSHTGGTGSALAYRAQVDAPPAILMPSSLQAPQPQEQNGILDWLRKLRLHKYYPVFKQLTMEKFLSLTEEDLNKFKALTMEPRKNSRLSWSWKRRSRSGGA